MDDPETVGDEDVSKPGEGGGEFGATFVGLGRLTGVESEILQEDDVAVGHRIDCGVGGLAHRVGGEGDRPAEDFAQASGDRSE